MNNTIMPQYIHVCRSQMYKKYQSVHCCQPLTFARSISFKITQNMDKILTTIYRVLVQSATIHIYSFPKFTLEIFLATMICLLFCYLHVEVTNIGKATLRIRPNTVHCRKSLRGWWMFFVETYLHCDLS